MSQVIESIQSIHPKVAEFYRVNKLEYFPKVEDNLKFIFETLTQGNPKTRRINTLTRIKKGNSEYIYTNEDACSFDSYGNPREFNQIVGRWELPHPLREYVPSENATLVTGISHMEIIYDIEHNTKNIEELLEYCSDDTTFFVQTGDKIYTSTREDFCNASFEDALTNRPVTR